MSKQHPPVVIVDNNDKVIGSANLEEVWEKGLAHRIVRIMAEDKTGRILLQKRSKHMELYPGCWDHSASGHVDEGDTYEQAAKRELQEELGIAGVPLTEIAYYETHGSYKGRKLNRFNKLYKVLLDANPSFSLEEHEVSEARWFTLAEIKKLIAEHPEQVTDGLVKVIEEYSPR